MMKLLLEEKAASEAATKTNNMELNEINLILKKYADSYTKLIKEDPLWKNSDWADHYNNLIDFPLKTGFITSSASAETNKMINDYIRENKLNYKIVGYTGCATYEKLN